MGSCWECKYLIDWERTNFVQDFKCNWFKMHKGQEPKTLWPKKNPDEGCKYFEPRRADQISST